MSVTIDTNYGSTFSPVLRMLVEQKTSKLRPTVTIEQARGEKHFFDRLGSFTASEVISRNQPSEGQDAAHSRRMATIRKYHATVHLDDLDKLQMMLDPTNAYTKKLASALGRKMDDVILDALLGSAASGKDGSSSASFDSNNQVDCSNSLDVANINTGLQKLEEADVDMDNQEIFLIIPASGVADLLGDSSNHLTSFDYQQTKALAGKNLPNFRGLTIIRSQRPDLVSGNGGRAMLMTEDTVKLAMAKDIKITVKDRSDLIDVMQLQATMSIGAVRMEEATAVELHNIT